MHTFRTNFLRPLTIIAVFAAVALSLVHFLKVNSVSAQSAVTLNVGMQMWDPGEDHISSDTTAFTFSLTGEGDVNMFDGQSHQYVTGAGTYELTVSTNINYTFVSCQADLSPAGGSTSSISNGIEMTLEAGQTANITCTVKQIVGNISGLVWGDDNQNGAYECSGTCESGLEGWSVYLDYNSNGVNDPSEIIANTVADGTFGFSGVYPGTYRVCEYVQDGWEQTYPILSGTHNCNTAVITSNSDVTDQLFGNRVDMVPSISVGVSPSDNVVSPQTITLTASGTGGDGTLTFGWSCNTGESSGNNTLNLTAVGSHTCTATVTDVDGDITTSVNTYVIQPSPYNDLQPTVYLSAIPSKSETEGTTVTLTANISSGNPGYDFAWSGTCAGSGHAGANDVPPYVLPKNAGSYYCRIDITDADGDKSSAGINVKISANAAPQVTTDDSKTTTLVTTKPEDVNTQTNPQPIAPESAGQVQGDNTANSDTTLIAIAGLVMAFTIAGVATVAVIFSHRHHKAQSQAAK